MADCWRPMSAVMVFCWPARAACNACTPASAWAAEDAVLLQAVDDLYENSVVSDATWTALAKKYSTEQMIDLVFTIGQYNLVSWALNSFGVPLDDYLPGVRK